MLSKMERDYEAERTRLSRRDLRRALRTGQVDISEIILQPPEEIKTATLYWILVSMGFYNPDQALKMMDYIACGPYTTMEELSTRQRYILIDELL